MDDFFLIVTAVSKVMSLVCLIHYAYLLLLISMLWHRQAIFKSKGDKSSSSAECRIRTQGLRHLFASRLNACWQTDWAIEDQAKNLNSTARPYDQQAFSPLDLIASWLSHLAVAIYIFVYILECSAVTIQSIFLKILTKDTPCIACLLG